MHHNLRGGSGSGLLPNPRIEVFPQFASPIHIVVVRWIDLWGHNEITIDIFVQLPVDEVTVVLCQFDMRQECSEPDIAGTLPTGILRQKLKIARLISLNQMV